jgi:hypothetical protein
MSDSAGRSVIVAVFSCLRQLSCSPEKSVGEFNFIATSSGRNRNVPASELLRMHIRLLVFQARLSGSASSSKRSKEVQVSRDGDYRHRHWIPEWPRGSGQSGSAHASFDASANALIVPRQGRGAVRRYRRSFDNGYVRTTKKIRRGLSDRLQCLRSTKQQIDLLKIKLILSRQNAKRFREFFSIFFETSLRRTLCGVCFPVNACAASAVLRPFAVCEWAICGAG